MRCWKEQLRLLEKWADIYLPSFNILRAPWITKTKTIVPIIKSGLLEFNQWTKTPAIITPKFMITSLDVKIMLACIWASWLFDFEVNRGKFHWLLMLEWRRLS